MKEEYTALETLFAMELATDEPHASMVARSIPLNAALLGALRQHRAQHVSGGEHAHWLCFPDHREMADAVLIHQGQAVLQGLVGLHGHGKIKSPLCCGQDLTCSL